jgi:AcrR family transcriptional regulator
MRPDRGNATRELIIATAERLFAERGMHAVSNRQVGEAAGQSNTAAVNYHFGTKADLVRAIAHKRAEQLEQVRVRRVADVAGSQDLRDWIGCLVGHYTDHMTSLGTPSWYARFTAQVTADPALHEITIEESLASPSLRILVDGINRCVPDLPAEVRETRWNMARHLIVHSGADLERALAAGALGHQDSWDALAEDLTDAIVGLWRAPVTRRADRFVGDSGTARKR